MCVSMSMCLADLVSACAFRAQLHLLQAGQGVHPQWGSQPLKHGLHPEEGQSTVGWES